MVCLFLILEVLGPEYLSGPSSCGTLPKVSQVYVVLLRAFASMPAEPKLSWQAYQRRRFADTAYRYLDLWEMALRGLAAVRLSSSQLGCQADRVPRFEKGQISKSFP